MKTLKNVLLTNIKRKKRGLLTSMIRTAMFILRIQWYTLAIGPGSLVDNPDPLT